MIIRNAFSSSHDIKSHVLAGIDTIPIDNNIVGRINLEDITHEGNTILANEQMINEEHIIELKKIGLPLIQIYSKELGEICFVNKNLGPDQDITL